MNETFPPVSSAVFLNDNSETTLVSKRSLSAGHRRQLNVMHTFRTLRHFNELHQSFNRAEKDYHAQVFVQVSGCEKAPPQKLVSSQRKLHDYSRSVYDGIDEVKNFRKTLFEERARQRAKYLLANQSSLNLGNKNLFSASHPSRLMITSAQSIGFPSPVFTPKIDPITSAKAKLSKFSMSFDPATKENQRMIIGFHGQRLTRDSFGVLIRQGMHIVLSIVEVDALYGTMDVSQDGTFDGKEFTRKFFNLGSTARRDKHAGMARDSSKYNGSRTMSNMEKETER